MPETQKDMLRILIVDDEPGIREVLADILQGDDRSIEVCDTPLSALEVLQHYPIDLAFVDLMLPGMSGIELSQKIKERYPHAHVVICSGYLAGDFAIQAGAGTADHFLQKPFNFGEVLHLAETMCGAQ